MKPIKLFPDQDHNLKIECGPPGSAADDDESNDVIHLMQRIATLEAKLAQALWALKERGSHAMGCGDDPASQTMAKFPCDCGLDDAIAALDMVDGQG